MLCFANCADKPFVRDVGLGDDQQPRRVLVDAVDDARPRDAADPGQPPRAMVEQRVDQGAVEIARGGMDDHAGGLVDDDQMIVLEDDVERDVLRRVVQRGGGGDADLVIARGAPWRRGRGQCRAGRLSPRPRSAP